MIERLKELMHELDCIQYGKFKLASGKESNYKIKCDPLFMNDEAKEILGTLGYRKLREVESNHGYYELVGVLTGGNEFAKIIAKGRGREVVSVDPHSKSILSGFYPSCLQKCYCEDVVTSGGSIMKCRDAIGMRFDNDCAISIVDREEGGKENLKNNGIELYSILKRSELKISEN